MNAGRDVERLITDWLIEEAAPGAPDRLLESARWAVNRTRQRRFTAAWRDHMSTSATRLVAVAAAIVVAVGAVAWFGRSTAPGPGGLPSPSLTVTTPPASPSTGPISTTAVALPGPGPFNPGTYIVGEPFELDLTIQIPTTGWTVWGGLLSPKVAPFYKGSPDPPGVGIVFNEVENVFANPCNSAEGLLDPRLGPTVDELVSALSNQPGTVATAPTDVTVAGYSGKHFEYTFVPETPTECTSLVRWRTDFRDREAIWNEHDELWVLDVDGTRLVIDLFSFDNSSAADIEEARRIVEGMIITP